MGTIADFEKWIGMMRSELGQQVIALEKLSVAFVENDIQLIRHDQVARLRILKARIMREVEDIERMETTAQRGANTQALLGGAAVLTLGSIFSAAKGRKDALNIGARMAGSVLSRKVPFGTVLIAVGKGGLPDDSKIIPLSRLARESNRSESEVETSLKYGGYLLMTPDTFAKVLDKVECGILDGSVSLPIDIDEFSKQVPEDC